MAADEGVRPYRMIELISAFLLSLATVTAAWCGYQSARWSGEQFLSYNQASTARVEEAKYENQAMLRSSIQVGLFLQYVIALARGDHRLADFLYVRFPAELKTATDAWLGTRPLQNPGAPKSPFEMSQYKLAQQEKARQAKRFGDRQLEAARQANALSDQYILLTVILTSVLFLGGISGKFRWRAVDAALLLLGIAVLLSILAILLRMPVH